MAPLLDTRAGDLLRVDEPHAVREVLRRVDDFAPDNALTAVTPLGPDALRPLARARFALPPVLASASGPAHLRVRRVVARFLTPAQVEAVRPLVVELTRERVDAARRELVAGGTVDLTEAVSAHVAPAVFGHLVGLAMPPTPLLHRWSRHSLELFWGYPDPQRQVVLADSAAELFTWLTDAIHTRVTGRPSLFDALRAAGVDEPRLRSLAFFLLIGGQETTAMLTDIALHEALTSGAWRSIAQDMPGPQDPPSEPERLVRQILTTTSSVPTWRRIAVRDTTIGGRDVAAGTPVLVELCRHEPGVIDDSLAFGFGVHRCLGARLAPLEASTVLAETAAGLPDVVPAGPAPQWLRLLSFQATRTVLVRQHNEPVEQGGSR